MRRTFRLSRLLLLSCALLLLFPTASEGERVEQLRPTNFLNDFAGAVDTTSTAKINALALEVQQKTGAQIAVVTVRTLEGDEASDFANRLFKQWGVGQKGKDRGVLVLLATADRKYWTEVGYGLEPILPDGKVGGFGREMVPLLRENRTGDALLLITKRIAETIATDAGVTLNSEGSAPMRVPTSSEPASGIPSWVILLIIFFLIGPLFTGLFSRRRRSSGCSGCLFPFFWPGGGLGGGGYYRGGGWGGGSSWGGFGGGSGGGFGGFGGGSSGGGGAGGSW